MDAPDPFPLRRATVFHHLLPSQAARERAAIRRGVARSPRATDRIPARGGMPSCLVIVDCSCGMFGSRGSVAG